MSAVCGQWRSAALNTPRLWRTLHLRRKNPLQQLATWTQRSALSAELRGVFNLRISYRATVPETLQVIKAWVGSPRLRRYPETPVSLEVDELDWSALQPCLDILPSGLKRLKCSTLLSNPLYIDLQRVGADLKGIEELHLTGVVFKNLPLPSFRHLKSVCLRNLSFMSSPLDVLKCLRDSHDLRELEIEFRGGWATNLLPMEQLDDVVFPALERVTLAGFGDWTGFFDLVNIPQMNYLNLSGSYADICGILSRAWTPSAPPPLRQLILNRCGVGTRGSSLLTLLRQLPDLERLHVTSCGDDLNPMVAALAGSPRHRAPADPSSDPNLVICPKLQHVDFSRSSPLKGVSVRDLVRSRLPPPVQNPDESVVMDAGDAPTLGVHLSRPEPPLPIHTLIIDQCPMVQPEILPWLRQNVPRVSCVYETKAQVRERMPRVR